MPLMALMMTACMTELTDELPQPAGNGLAQEGRVALGLTATVVSQEDNTASAATRAGVDVQSTQLPNGATFRAEFSGSDVTETTATYTADGTGGATASPQPYFTLTGTSTTVSAYHGKSGGTGGTQVTGATTSFTVASDQTGDAAYQASDLMYATATVQKSNPVGALTFTHRMAKIIVNATLGDGISSISAVKIIGGLPTVALSGTDCTVGAASGTAFSTSNPLTVHSGTHSSGTLSCAALIPPQTVNANFLQIVTDKGTVTYSLSNKAFATAQSYTFNITINAAAIGTTVAITGWTGTGNVTVQPTETNAPANAVAVDLGLSVKWANMNVGAEKVTDYGTYFAWGETDGITVSGATTTISGTPAKTYFSWDTYAWCKGTSSTFTKYCPTDKQSSNWWNPKGSTVAADNKTQLELGDDAARANWGGKWRMPTQAEMQELADTKSNTTNYTWTWCDGSSVKYNNTTVKGWKIESKKSGTAGNHIFLPAAGFRDAASFSFQGSRGYYLSSTLYTVNPGYAWLLYFSSSVAYMDYNLRRCGGYTVRAVQSK